MSNTNLRDRTWAGSAWIANGNTIEDVFDIRDSESVLNVKVSKEFNVKSTTPRAYGYYVTLDKIYAVNWDGTLVNPDGKSFYVEVSI